MTSSVKNAGVVAAVGLVVLVSMNLAGSKRASALAAKVTESSPSVSSQGAGITWDYQRIGISTSGGQLRILLADLSPTTDYIVGVCAAGEQATGLVAGEVLFSHLGSKSIRTISQIVDWPQDRLDVQSGIIKATGLSQSVGSILLYITVAAGTEVSIETPDRTIARGTLSNGLVVHNGVFLAQEVAGIRTLVSQLANPQQASNTVRVFKTQDNQYVATPKWLGTNLISLKKPSCPVGITAANLEVALLRITIDEGGIVRQIIPVRGNQAFLETATQAVKDWTFRPFVPEGKPVPVVASIIFFFGPNGTVSSPVFDEMGK